ncbi:MAG: ABC transporter ATP-binding protein [Candidatus Binatia bacterium]|nr:ABC transporter ATP-binding protein [Candidatus Binatia bacterium]
MFGRVRRRLRPHAGPIAVGIGLATATSLAELAKPWPIKIVVDQVLGDAPGSRGDFLADFSASQLLTGAAVGLVLLSALLGALALASNRLTIDVGQRMVQDLREDLFAHLERLSVRFHDRRSSGELVYRLAADTMALQTLAMNAVFPTLSAVLFLVGMIVVMLRMNVELTLLALAVTPFIALSVRRLGRRVEQVAAEARVRESDFYAAAEASMSAIRVTQAFRGEAVEAERFGRASRASLERHLDLYTTQTAYSFAVSVLGAVGSAAVLWLGARLVLAGELSVGDLLVFLAYLASFYAPISTLSHTFGLVQEARVGLARVFELLDVEPEPTGGEEVLSLSSVEGAFSVEGVDFAYEAGTQVLHRVSLEVRAGEKLALVGPSGSGKTTLALLLMRFLDPDEGFVRLDGVDLRRLSLDSLRSVFGVVLQPPLVLPGTVRENVAYGREGATDEDVERALRVAQFWDVVDALPHGIETSLEIAGARLSQGERQRLTVARALVGNAPVLLFDEPTASLDVVTERRLLAALERERGKRTCILIAHGPAALAWADRVAVLRDGRIVAVGTPAELRDRAELRDANASERRTPEGSAGEQ